MTTIELDRRDLARGCMDATADLRSKSLHDVVEYFATYGQHATTYWDGYSAILNQAELVAWDLWRASCATQPTHARSVAA